MATRLMIPLPLKALARGIYYGYPPCCILNYVLDAMNRERPLSARERGGIDVRVRKNGQTKTYVPCVLCARRLVRKGDPRYRPPTSPAFRIAGEKEGDIVRKFHGERLVRAKIGTMGSSTVLIKSDPDFDDPHRVLFREPSDNEKWETGIVDDIIDPEPDVFAPIYLIARF
jgi:hypothetical protein